MKTSHQNLISEFTFKVSRSSGKGGQHVNKTESRVSLFFDINASNHLNEEEKQKLIESKIFMKSSSEVIQIDSEATRSQLKNKKISIEKFYELLEKVFKKKKKRKPTKPSKAAIRKRLKMKKALSDKKKLRRKDY